MCGNIVERDTGRPVPPSLRREDGFLDAQNGKPALSGDEHYLFGYEFGKRMKENAEQGELV